MLRLIFWLGTHAATFLGGLALGIYLLPILTAPEAPDAAQVEALAAEAMHSADFSRDLEGSDFLHWGEGTISLGPTHAVHRGKLAPGPDYRLYLVNGFVEDEAGFLAVKDTARFVGEVRSFGGFVLPLPEGVDLADYDTALIWCEAFGEFITAAKYR